MTQMLAAFFSLYLATLLLLAGSGLFNTYMGLRLTAQSVSELWVGGLIAVYYLGLVFGARIGHKIIIQVGHIRAYEATAAIVTITILVLALLDNLWRSEEHTSELQSLMSISYAVFCLKKKNDFSI